MFANFLYKYLHKSGTILASSETRFSKAELIDLLYISLR